MTIYGWDASHYDGTLTKTILTRAKAEGIEFFTHKLGEGLGDNDPTAATALAAARDIGITLLGGYWFIHDNDNATAAARACIAQTDAHEPWWRDFPGWFWQTDAEVSSTGLPSPAYVKAFSNELAALSGKQVIVYASRGMYNNKLTGLGRPLWNADYGSNPHGGLAVYPGDTSDGWKPYSGITPTLLQFGSNVTIAGLTTCDANAYRGTLAELTTIIEGDDMPLSDADVVKIWTQDGIIDNQPWRDDFKTNPKIQPGNAVEIAMDEAHAAGVQSTANAAALAVLETKVNAIPITAVPAAPLSDTDVQRIANMTADILYGRLKS